MSRSLKRLQKCFQEYVDPRDAMRAHTGETIADIARRLGVRRTDMNLMLSPHTARRYIHIRRLLEVEYGLPPYSLDALLDQEG